MGETAKAAGHRKKDGWFEKYAPDHLSGIDLGCQHDPLNETFRRWDVIFGDGDAELMEGVSDCKFQTVYASHLLEHVNNPQIALKNWWRILRPTGHLIICVPHRDLYEKKKELPSNWNFEHKSMWLPETYEEPCTLSLKHEVLKAIPDADIVSLKILDEGRVPTSPNEHPIGEFAIEIIVRKQ